MTYVKDTKKAPLAVALAVLAAMGYGGYTIIKEIEPQRQRLWGKRFTTWKSNFATAREYLYE